MFRQIAPSPGEEPELLFRENYDKWRESQTYKADRDNLVQQTVLRVFGSANMGIIHIVINRNDIAYPHGATLGRHNVASLKLF